jgi:hypothetical protein
MSEWISVKNRLPEAPEYDWVLVQTKMIPEGYCGVPHIAELRRGVWHSSESDSAPYKVGMEEFLSIKVTHWMPLPEPPNNKKPCPECDGKGEYLCTGMSYQGYGKTVKCPTCQGTGEIDD